MKTPDEEVAGRIIEQLRKEGLLSEIALAKLGPKLAAGTLSADDWKLTLELDRTDKKKATERED